MKSVSPRLASGTYAIIVFFVSLLIEIATGLPLLSEYAKYVIIFGVISVILVYKIFNSKYDPEDNDDVKMFVIHILLGVLFVSLAYVYFSRPH